MSASAPIYTDNVSPTDLHSAADFISSINNHIKDVLDLPRIELTYDALAVHSQDDDQYTLLVHMLGGKRERRDGTTFRPPYFARIFTGFEVRVHPPRDTQTCRRVPTGRKVTETRYVDNVEVQVDEYKWECAL